jgi:hypothetical protein
VWVVHDDSHQTRLAELAAEERIELLDEFVHDLKGAKAATINNAGEEAQVAYLLDGRDCSRGDGQSD